MKRVRGFDTPTPRARELFGGGARGVGLNGRRPSRVEVSR